MLDGTMFKLNFSIVFVVVFCQLIESRPDPACNAIDKNDCDIGI